jgi:PAS domain S-box-containing protein
MFEAALDCIVTMDAAGRVVDFNAAAERTFGYDRAEARGKTVAELIIPPDLREAHERAFARHLTTGVATILGKRLELRAMRRDGTEIPVELTITRSDFEAEPLFIAFLRDLSGMHAAQAALEHAERRFRDLVEQVPTVTYVCDFDEALAIRYISPQIERLTGYAPELWTSDPAFWKELIHPDDRERFWAEIDRCTRAELPIDMEYRMRAADGSYVHVWGRSASAAPTCRSAAASGSACSRATRPTRQTCSCTPTPRCTMPSAPGAAPTPSIARRRTTRTAASS